MSPPLPYRDLWLAAALGSSTLSAAAAPASQTPAPIGVITAIAQTAAAGADNTKQMAVGSGVAAGQRLQTHGGGPLHILFLDQSAITLNGDSELVIQEFTYDEESRTGKIQVELTQGSLRIVGGYISKNTPAVINTPHGKVEVSGGISTVETGGQNTSATFLFGQQMQVSNEQGTRTVTRPGFGTTFSPSSSIPASPIGPVAATTLGLTRTDVFSPEARGSNYEARGANFASTTINSSLVSLSDSKSGSASSAGPNSIAQDRISGNVTNSVNSNPTQTLTNSINGNPTQPLANILRTNSTTISS